MAKKTPKPKGIPLESVLTDPNFRRHYEILMREPPGSTDPKLVEAISEALFSNASANVKAKQETVRRNKVNGTGLKRPEVTKETLLNYRNQYEAKHGRTHGWKKTACWELGITLNTLDRRLKT